MPVLSFPRRRESRRIRLKFWFLACAGMTCKSRRPYHNAQLTLIVRGVFFWPTRYTAVMLPDHRTKLLPRCRHTGATATND
jgi:hypothetical protein